MSRTDNDACTIVKYIAKLNAVERQCQFDVTSQAELLSAVINYSTVDPLISIYEPLSYSVIDFRTNKCSREFKNINHSIGDCFLFVQNVKFHLFFFICREKSYEMKIFKDST